ncbi:ATP-dependent DNA ligase [Pseudonocardiaceae bacterium YIM PH 21723]|nr:ATP-dependent DNA ligase [Pseudonocardiaceae bacterium YIM PH 21723]
MVRRTGVRAAGPVTVRVDDRTLKLSNLEKVLYPEIGLTKAEVLDYYRQVAPVLLPHLADRPVTLRRYPNGADGPGFYEKDVSRHAPDWVRTVRLATPRSTKGAESADYAVIADLPTLMWAANLAALELHVPQWRVGPRGGEHPPDLLVFDLDPGPDTSIVDCCRVAELVRAELDRDGLRGYPKTSGSKGLQLYAPVQVRAPRRTGAYARELAERLARRHPELIVAVMTKARRAGRVLIDWSQNNPAKTTVAPYSLRARPAATASTPISWDEVTGCTEADQLAFTARQVLERVRKRGDLLAGLHEEPGRLPR